MIVVGLSFICVVFHVIICIGVNSPILIVVIATICAKSPELTVFIVEVGVNLRVLIIIVVVVLV